MKERVKITVLPDGRLDAKSAAAYLGLSPKTLAMKLGSGADAEYVKRGRVFYFKADLDAWVAVGRAESTTEAAHKSQAARRLPGAAVPPADAS